MKYFYLFFLTLVLFGCQINEMPEPDASGGIEVLEASNGHKNAFNEWMGAAGANLKVADEFNSGDLVHITDSEYSRWAVPKNGDPNTSMSFVFDEKNNIDRAFISTSFVNPADKSITSNVYSLDNRLIMEMVHFPDGSVKVINKGTPGTYGFGEWWDEYEYCVGSVTAPFDSVIANIAMDAVFMAVTLNMWVPAVLLTCTGVASGRYSQK
jgi:hypothetical protein